MAAPETVHVIATANDAARTVQTLDLSMELHIADGGWSTVRLVKVADERLVWKRARQPVAFKVGGPRCESAHASICAHAHQHRELEVHRDLRHEHIVQIVYSWYERAPAGEDTAHLNLLLAPYVPLTLAQSPLPLSEPAAMQHAAQVLAALAYLHETPRSIAHRDIKPDNILVQPGRDGGATTVYLCDFGCAKRILESEQNGTEVGEQKIRARECIL
jgi:serine/threonine protein kinase